MSAPRLTALCPAKVNLSLRVLGRREDGYHELDTVFQAIDLWDRIEARPADELRLECAAPDVPTDESNLVLRAARLVHRRARGRPGAVLRLTKEIPVRGGLGGGSSNAAGALRLCAELWDVGLGAEELGSLAAELGADVPFFLVGGTARGRGRGDRIEPLPFAGPLRMVLGVPPFGVSTAEVFAAVPRRLTHPGNGVSVAAVAPHKWQEHNDLSLAVNDLEAVVFPRWPELRTFRDALLRNGAEVALLSGSGSTVFGIFRTAEGELDEVVADLAAGFDGWRIRQTRAVPGAVQIVR